MKFENMALLALNLKLFDGNGNTNVTTDLGLSDEMKTYYSDYLIDQAEAKLVHNQFGQKRPIPEGKGKEVEFRKYDPLPKLTTPLSEGVTPNGQKITMGTIKASVKQYGGYVELSDILLLTAIDNNLTQATKLLGSQAGRTLDTITRETLNGGQNILVGDGTVLDRSLITKDHKLTVDCIKRAARHLKVMNAEPIGDSFVAVIHPDCSYDLTNDKEWKYPHQYQDTTEIYNGEIGKIGGVRFVETTEAKIFHAKDLASDARELKVSEKATASATVKFTGGAVATDELKGRKVIINEELFYVTANTATSMTLSIVEDGAIAASVTCDADTVIYPGEAGAGGIDVYSTLVFGDNAYGVLSLSGGGLEHIVKQLGSAGTGDPLNQRATAGWKATAATVRLVEAYMIRIETASTFDFGEN